MYPIRKRPKERRADIIRELTEGTARLLEQVGKDLLLRLRLTELIRLRNALIKSFARHREEVIESIAPSIEIG